MDQFIKEKARRRVFVFMAAFVVLAIGHTIGDEIKEFADVFDDIVFVGIAIVTLILAWKWRKTADVALMRREHKIMMILFALALIAQIVAFPLELDDPNAFGNEIPSAMLFLMIFANYFI